MCGIAGFVGDGTRDDLKRMTDALRHRGPDGEGFFVDQNARIFLGHRRLAIVDIASGHQPMWNEDRQVGVVFNGEIYNHAELRAELTALGHVFASSHSDTEVLVHGYEHWGQELPLRLNGMFAFAVLDRRCDCLFLARDRFGEKPLYYGSCRGSFAFASELTALSQHPSISGRLDQRSLQKFFAYGFLPAPCSMLEGTRKLPGGFWLRHDIASGETISAPYWQFDLEPDESLSDEDEPDLVEELGDLLGQAAKRRLMSDVPLGLFLSGGLDSSCILASLSTQVTSERLNTFTVGFTEPSFDESRPASLVAESFATQHYQRVHDLTTARDLIPSVLSRLDEPLGDASVVPTHLLCAFAREQVTVALSGDGGDELFAGYDPFAALAPAQFYARTIPRRGHKLIRTLADLLPMSHRNMSLDFKLRRTLLGLSYPDNFRLPVWMSPLDPADLRDLFESPLRVEDVYQEAIALWDGAKGKSTLDRALEYFTRLYLPDDILAKVDRASMMCSLETRAVLLDNDLVDFCRRLPGRFKYRNGQRKYLLKKVARTQLPSEIVDRKKKGFGIPLAKWLKEVPRVPPLSPVPGLRMPWVEEAWVEHRRGTRDHRLFLWSWLSLQEFQTRVGA